MLELQEAVENTLFRPTKGGHLGTASRAAEHGNEGYDEKLSKVVLRVLGARIRNVIEGGKEDVHGGSGLQEMNPTSRIDPALSHKRFRSRRQCQMRFPWKLNGDPNGLA